MIKGQVVGGEFGKVILRQKSDVDVELGELVVCGTEVKFIMQVYSLLFGSQISAQNLELISGLSLEENDDIKMFDDNIRLYNLAILKNLITVKDKSAFVSKSLPGFFSNARGIKKEDLNFITRPKNPLLIGKLRSGSKVLDVDINLPGEKVLSHHILIPATTGRGKSNLCSTILWNTLDQDYCGFLVLDPHDEYYGRNKFGLKDHPSKKVVYYTPNNPPPGARSLNINIKLLKPSHFNGVVWWSDPQIQALYSFYKEYGPEWIEAIIKERKLSVHFDESTLAVIKRRILALLELDFDSSGIYSRGIYETQGAERTVKDIVAELEDSKTVIIDTSSFSGGQEILIGSLITTEIFNRYRSYKIKGELKEKPVVSIVLEEAPRVLGKDVLEKGSNVFSTIAREGRKFKVGLTAITQLPSLIPRQILANMNTKIILGIEMGPERQAIIESAAQDLSTDGQNIASLNVGEAIVTSNFTKFATPIKIPLFEEYRSDKAGKTTNSFSGVI